MRQIAIVMLFVIGCSVDEPELERESAALAAAASPEPTTGAVAPKPGDESAPRDPFTAYGIGPAEAAWPYDKLTADEKVVADRGRAQPGWDAVHAAYRTSVVERSTRARASAAARQLAIANLEILGVVP